MKTLKVVLGIIILLATIKTAIDVLPYEHGAGLGGAVIGFLILLTVSLLLIYFGTKSKSSKNAYEKPSNTKTKLDSTIENLKDLREKGILSEEEYRQKNQKLESEKVEQDLKNSTEYKQLKSLFDSGVLTKEEFESKISLLKYTSKNETHKQEIEETIKTSSDTFKKVIIVFLYIFSYFMLLIAILFFVKTMLADIKFETTYLTINVLFFIIGIITNPIILKKMNIIK